jgi:3-carboxy-cis,cis-muconate cycloisomerase
LSLSPFDHSLLSGLLGDAEIAPFLSAEADLKAMLAFEKALAEAQAELGVVPAQAGSAIAAAIAAFEPDMGALAAATAQDGVAVPELMAQLKARLGEPFAKHVHFGATSQDVIDTSLALRLKRAAACLDARLAAMVGQMDAMAKREEGRSLTAHTRMQRAGTVGAAHKLASWRDPLIRHRERLTELGPRLFLLQLGGAVGDRAALGGKAREVAERMAGALGLGSPDRARHSERDGVAEFANWLSLVSGSLGKMGADIGLMAQTEVGEIVLRKGGRSSAIPGKSNPVGAETLVALARFNATLLGGMHHALVHENERSGAAWTLEWMLLPQMVMASAASLRQAASLLESIGFSRP